MKSLMRAWGLYPLTKRNGMSLTEFNNLMDRVENELEQLHLKPYLALYAFKAAILWTRTLTKEGTFAAEESGDQGSTLRRLVLALKRAACRDCCPRGECEDIAGALFGQS
jgi:hypothetical protein